MPATLDYSVYTPPHHFNEGDQVMLNLEHIANRGDFNTLNERYRAFVEDNQRKVFTVHIERGEDSEEQLISLNEQPEWLFWSGDLTLYTDEVTQ